MSLSVYNDSECASNFLPSFSWSAPSINYTSNADIASWQCAPVTASPPLLANFSCPEAPEYADLAYLRAILSTHPTAKALFFR